MKNNNFLSVILIAVLFGLGAGMVGDMVAKSYFLSDSYILPFFGDINLTDRAGSLVIRDAKNIIVKQEDKTKEVADESSRAFMGIFAKKDENSASDDFLITDFYDLNSPLAQALIVTSDGWLLSDFDGLNQKNINNFVVISKENKIYEIEDFEEDEVSGLSFLKLKGVFGLSINAFAELSDVEPTEIVISSKWPNIHKVIYISGVEEANFVKSSDKIENKIIFEIEPYANSALFDMEGKIVAFVDNKQTVYPAPIINSAIKSLLESGRIERPSLGLRYIDLSQTIYGKKDFGALVFEVSEERKEIFEKGDIIKSLNNIAINKENKLNYFLQNYLPGQVISVLFERNGEEIRQDVEILELK